MARRIPNYISPSALECWLDKPQEYYLRYLAPIAPPKFEQTKPMAIGSAFDAYVKSYLHEALFGKNHRNSPKFDLGALFDAQVEKQHRTFCWPHGKYLLEKYKESGALADLMLELNDCADEPRFEFDIKGEVKGYREGVTKSKDGVVLMGKPDVRFINSCGAHCIFDWKVNGYCANRLTSPDQGYINSRCQQTATHWNRDGAHRHAQIMKIDGLWINVSKFLDEVDEKWARQNATYGWLMGEPVGAQVISGIDQFACDGRTRYKVPDSDELAPQLRIVSHRTRVSEKFQFETFAKYQDLWLLIHETPLHFFKELSLEQSEIMQAQLDHTSERLSVSSGNAVVDAAYKWSR